MGTPIVSLRNVSKCFMAGLEARTLFGLFKKVTEKAPTQKKIWVLKDIYCEVSAGEAVGIIGSNGSGKTTLLKIISGIYRQASGTVEVNGTIAAFLQLGIGMYRDLSALENTYLFGAIMGLGREEITGKVNAIIDFSGLSDFMYSPLRDFSMGMIQRLAFSIAKETNAEILLLDEILAAADSDFAEKCFHFLKESKDKGKTIIISSHSLNAIKEICDKVLLLDKGRQIAFGPASEVMGMYVNRKA